MTMAAKLGSTEAQYNLGVFFAKGLIGPRDLVSAYMWLKIAAINGLTTAESGADIVSSSMSPAQIAEAKDRILRCISSDHADCD